MLPAAHYTPLGRWLTASTVETGPVRAFRAGARERLASAAVVLSIQENWPRSRSRLPS